ncbi:MAG: hypothetical protein Q4C03_02690, partial [bacterium]|nr:hypothetical protein [bacterium]
MAQELAIIKQENIQTIVQSAPQSYLDNKVSQDNCNRAGQAILDAIMQQGMTDELDQQAATFIEKSRKTVKKMNERRSPVTKLFDDIRKEYTVLENSIDPTKAGTIAYQLQEQRNKFAAKKRAEEEERRRKEFERQQAEQARSKMKQDIEDDFKQQFMALTNKACNDITAIDNNVSLDNYTTSLNMFKEWNTALPADFLYNLHTTIRIPAGVPVDELRKIELETKERLAEQYAFEVESMLEYVLDRMPSKKANLERMSKASAEEAARIKAEMEERQR